MIFLTVGTLLPFDRLIRAVDDAFDKGLVDEEVFAQIGKSLYKPRNFESVASLAKELFDGRLKQASGVIGHAGMGTIIMALDHNKPLLAMPRLKKYGEHVNDHQLAIAKRFEISGYLLAAYEAEDLAAKIKQLKTFVPNRRDSQPQMVAGRIAQFLMEIINK
jgi:UDP-N-acetylglucosamine transferase subunit ALG13